MFVEGKLDKFIQTLKSSGLDEFVEEALNLVAMLYISKEIPSMYRDSVTLDIIRSGRRTNRPQYKTTIDPKVLTILKNFGLVHENARGSGELRKYFAYLTDEGKEIGEEVILSRINAYSKEIDDIIREFGKMSAVIVAGTVERFAKEHILRFELDEEDIFERLLLYSNRKVSDYYIHRELVKMGREVELKYGKKERITPLLSLICHFLTYYNYSRSRNFFNRLERFGLAYEVPVYDSYARFIHYEIRCPLEVAEYVLSDAPAFESELLWEFGSLVTILELSKLRDPRVARENFERYLDFYRIPIDIVKRILDELSELGITSRYIGLPDSGPFLVLDNRRFEEIVKRRLIDTALMFLR